MSPQSRHVVPEHWSFCGFCQTSMMETMLEPTTYLGNGESQPMVPCGEVAVTEAGPLHWANIKDWRIEEAK